MIKVSRVEATGFYQYASLTLDIPDNGLAVVTGPNGAGKSTLPEVICWVMYNRTLRNKSPAGVLPVFGRVVGSVSGRPFDVTRTANRRGQTTLKAIVDGVDVTAQTMTDTQARLNDFYGGWSAFVSSRMFTKTFTAKFAAATDKERKALLETALGLERFERAQLLVRKDEGNATHDCGKVEARLNQMTFTREQHREVLAKWGTTPDAEIATSGLKLAGLQAQQLAAFEVQRKLGNALEAARTSWHDSQRERSRLSGELSTWERTGAEATAKAARLAAITTCPVCLQDVGPDAHAAIHQHVAGDASSLVARVTAAKAQIEALDSDNEEAAEMVAAMSAQYNEAVKVASAIRDEHNRVQASLDAAHKHLAAFDAARQNLAVIDIDMLKATAEVERYQHHVAILTIVGEAMGLRGARNLLMTRALNALEDSTNATLTALGYPVSISLSGTRTLASGDTVDTLTVELVGAGGGDYNGASSGEQARVDVALMLGLGAILSNGESGGLVVFDEVFDTLDAEGIERVAAYLTAMSDTHQVIVISHNQELLSLFPRGRHLSVVRDNNGHSALIE